VTFTETYQVVADSENEAISLAEEYSDIVAPTTYDAQAEIIGPSLDLKGELD
jgi:hypothetical protein